MATNRKYEDGRFLYLTVGSGVESGDFVQAEGFLGVAQYDADDDNKAVIDTEGVYDLSVTAENSAGNSAISKGDGLYFDGTDINKKSSGAYVGKALEAVTSGSTATIMVKLNALDNEALPSVQVLSETVALADFTDNEDATGYVDLSTDLPAGAIPLGTILNVATAFDASATATAQVGVSGDLDRFTEQSTLDVSAIGIVGSTPAPEAMNGVDAAATPRVTVTEDSDFGDFTEGEMTVKIYYVETA